MSEGGKEERVCREATDLFQEEAHHVADNGLPLHGEAEEVPLEADLRVPGGSEAIGRVHSLHNGGVHLGLDKALNHDNLPGG